MSDEKKKRGRPLKNGAKEYRMCFRLTRDEYEYIKNISLKVGKPMSSIGRAGLLKEAKNESEQYDEQYGYDDFYDDYEEYDDDDFID